MMFGPVVNSAGPPTAKIVLLGEAPGSEETDAGAPFVGPSGRELRRMLRTIGIDFNACYRTNVFSRQPAGNNLGLYGTPTPSPTSRLLGPLTTNPITFVDDAHLPELDRLRGELAAVNPNVVIALGNTACWALLEQAGINNLRGTVHVSEFLPGRQLKVVPTFHPAAILRQWNQRVICIADLEKAHVESASPTLTFDNTEIWLEPTLDDLAEFGRNSLLPSREIATDVETKRGQITCVSFAPNPSISVCVPFWQDGPSPNYWLSQTEELAAWKWVRYWIESPAHVKVMQNGLYDIQYFRRHGMEPRNCTEDTMLAHHSLYSELNKGLGFLGSIYTRNPSWKGMRKFSRTLKEEQLKRDD